PEDQFNDTNIYKDVYVEIWQTGEESTIELFNMNQDPIIFDYIFQDENISFYYWVNFTRLQEHVDMKRPGYSIVNDSYAYIEINFVSSRLKYELTHTPFNFDYVGAQHTTYHIKLTIQGEDPIYSYDPAFDDYILKIEDNYIYFNDKKYGENGYIANKTQITVEYKFKLQPGLLDQKHFTMIIYPYKSFFDTVMSSITGPINYRDGYRKLSGSSIISPFDYSLSINDTYSLYLSYRLNEREYFEEKFVIDYSSGVLDFYYMQGGIDNYVSELIDSEGVAAVQVYYYNTVGQKQILDPSHYDVDTVDHMITLLNDGNPVATPNDITEFWVSFIPALNDYQLFFYKFYFNQSFDPTTNSTEFLQSTLQVENWKVIDGELYDIIPNFNAYYYINDSESAFHYYALSPEDSVVNYAGYVSQLSAFLEDGEKLVFNLTGELKPVILNSIREGDYASLYINAFFHNYDSLDSFKIELFDSSDTLLSQFTTVLSLEDLLFWNFNIRVELPTTSNNLEYIQFTPIFRTDEEYSSSNAVGIPRFEFLKWNSTLVNSTDLGYDFMVYALQHPLFVEENPLELAYMFNEQIQYLSLPDNVIFDWKVEQDDFGNEQYFLYIPNTYLNPNNSAEQVLFEDGDKIMLRYNSPVNKTIQIGIERTYFHKKPIGFDTLPIIAESLLIYTTDTTNYTTFTEPYSYNISLQLTPFDTEHSGTYKDLLININLTTLESFAVDGYIDFSHIVFSVPNPAYELTLNGTAIVKMALTSSGFTDEFNGRVWQFTELEQFTSSPDPINDEYNLTLDNTPLFYNDPEEGKWLEYIKIYDENYNYYSAGISGDEYQLLYNTTTGNFTWNSAFDKFQEYWGMQIEIASLIDPNTTLYFEYATSLSWAAPTELNYPDVDSVNLDIYYNFEYLLTPRYEEWYDNITENTNYDYEVIQYYSESFSVYESVNHYSYIFEIEYNFTQDFIDLSLYKIVGLYANLSSTFIIDDDVNYDISFDVPSKNITITDLNAADGLLNQFDLITVI
ncbi:hypothetical protein LCGC14_1685500, partial [marine sediment metagenome]